MAQTHSLCPGVGLSQRKKEQAVRQWVDDGLKVKTNVPQLVTNASAKYWADTRLMLRDERIIELVMDSTVFATVDVQVTIAFGCRRNASAYVVPHLLRHLRWRHGDVGEVLTEQEQALFDKTGFHSKVAGGN